MIITRLVRHVHDYMGALIALVVIFVVLSVTRDAFLSLPNLQNVLQSNVPLLIISIGMTFVVISGGFDLSVGAVMALGQYLLMVLINNVHVTPPLAILVTVASCGIVGAIINGLSIGVIKLNFFVTTLAAMILIQGVVLIASDGNTIAIDSEWLTKLGNNNVGILPLPVLISLALLLSAGFILRMTTFGRSAYCVGGNMEAARLAGISGPIVVIGVYGVCSMCGAFAGVMDAARLGVATPTAGSSIALTSAAAVLLGGASLAGGVGKVSGTLVGVLVLAFLGNGVDLYGISPYWQDVVTGAVLLAAILVDRINKSSTGGRMGKSTFGRREILSDA